MRLYSDLFTSSNAILSLDADISVSTYSNPDGVGSDPVMFGNGNIAPSGVRPKNDVNKSSLVKLFWYSLIPKSLIASATKSFDTPYSKRLSALYFLVTSL